MKDLLKGKKGIITGALDDKSIAWKVALKAHEQGADILLTNAPVALRMGQINELAEQLGTEVIPADATNLEDINKLYDVATERFGGKFDFLLHSIGMSPNVRKKKPYTALDYGLLEKTYDVSAVSFHKMMAVAYERDVFNDWSSIVALSYIAAQRAFPDYNDMADAKALLESITRSFGAFWGMRNKTRVNTVSQSPTATTAGTGVKGFELMLNYAENLSPLGNASADSCADFVVAMFSDLTRMITMQNIFHDGGFSVTGISPGLLANEAFFVDKDEDHH